MDEIGTESIELVSAGLDQLLSKGESQGLGEIIID